MAVRTKVTAFSLSGHEVVPSGAPSATPPWRSRIVASGSEVPEQLVANPSNWRVHPRHQREALAGSLDTVGWVRQVLVNRRSGFVIDGHARVALAVARKEPLVPVLYVDLDPDEERLVLATLDPIGALAGHDSDRLTALLADVAVDDAGLRALLDRLAADVPRAGLTDPDAVPEVPNDTDLYVQPGEIWELGRHRLMIADATNADNVARLLAGATPRLLVTDPAYGIELDLAWRDRLNGRGARSVGHRNTSIVGDTRADWSAAYALVPSLEVAYVWHATAHMRAVADGLEAVGFELRQQIVWVKTQAALSRSAYAWQHEPCWYAVRTGKTAEWIGDHTQTTVWELASPKMIMGGSTEPKYDHPNQKPAECMARPIRNHAGDAYEPFAGSGTTIIAAEQLGRRCFALEIDPKYAQVAIERWQAFTGQQARRA